MEKHTGIPPLFGTFGLFFLCKSKAIILFEEKNGMMNFVKNTEQKSEIKNEPINDNILSTNTLK